MDGGRNHTTYKGFISKLVDIPRTNTRNLRLFQLHKTFER